ncbi:hypothetical protein VTK56DRAFT_3170 [Thermocarpiscus australiensis]
MTDFPSDKEKGASDSEPLTVTRSHDGDKTEEKLPSAGSIDAPDKTPEEGEAGHEPEPGEGDEERRADLHRLRSIATATSKSSVTAAGGLPEQKPWYKQPNPLRWGKIPPVPKEREVCPEYKAGFFSSLTFQWIASLMSTGYKRPLEFNDIYSINPDRSVDPLTDKMRQSFKRRVANGDKYPLLWAMHETFFWEFWLGGFCSLISVIMQVMSPFTLRYLIQFATDAYIAAARGLAPPQIGTGIGLVLGVTAMQILQSLGTNHFIYRGMLVGGMARASLISLIYEKSMVISGRAKAGGAELPDVPAAKAAEKESKDKKSKGKKRSAEKQPGISGDGTGWGNGRIVNLMSVDTYRIDQASGLFHIIWTAPIACLITLVLLLVNLTYSALAGFALLAIGVPVLTNAIKKLFVRRKAINKITDQRVSLTQEILQSVRFVKFFGWEASFLKRLEEFRNREISSIQVLLAIRNAIMAVSLSMPIFASMLSFITYSLTHHSLAPAQVFSSLALFNGLRMPLNMLPLVIGQVTDAWSSLSRIQEFLLAEEREEEAIFKPDAPNAVEMRNASFTWERTPTQDPEGTVGGPLKGKGGKGPKQKSRGEKHGASPADSSEDASTLVEEREPFKLQDLTFEIGRNELVAVIGTVGSGKTSLLAALAGDMRKTGGKVVLGASRAFCPQYAWIQNATVQENILFGRQMDKEWYAEVIKACALQPDLDMLPNHDQTEIGERGITISGGQKQRLNIARAIYFDADIILMDDPLSAVDAHVGRHIFDNAILGLLKDKCRILATHQLWVLSRCDRIIWMDEGKIRAIDTFDNLMKNSEEFQQLMESTAIEQKKDGAAAPTQSPNDDGQSKKKKKGKSLMQAEERAVASVPWSVYTSYIRASGTILNAPIVIGLLILTQGANISTSLWLSYWTSDKFGFAMGTYIGVYAGLAGAQATIMFCFMVSLSIFGTTASKKMLRDAITRVLRAPMSFFDTTPLGRITNRFSRDVDVMDNNLTEAMRMYFFSIGSIIAVFALIIAFFHWFAIALAPLFVLFLFVTGYYRASAREVKRLEALLRSTVFAKFAEGLSGVASIRAYGLRDRFVADLRKAIDDMDSAYFLTYSNQRWLSVRLDMIGNCLVFTTGILVVTSRFSVDPSVGGLVLSYILAIVQMIQFTVRQLAEVENGMNSVERLLYYGRELEEEAPLKTIEVRKTWPEKGEIIFDNVQMRYRPGLPLVLQGLSMHIRGGERIGIVGRTGAGKSSIMSALFRLVELSGGHIIIDGIDISTIGLQDLRSRLAIIPQDPTLFRGTVRSNLDPFGEHTDLELWSALRQADLVPADGGPAADPNAPSPNNNDNGNNNNGTATATTKDNNNNNNNSGRIHLDTVVEEDGLNFSLGQRQLMALARALVRGAQIIVCDEATSSVDMETDDKIQATMATGFRGRTLLCIAHRLHTIIGYDRICVMDKGRIAEMGAPLELWRMEGGIFRGMCERSGIRAEDIRRAREGVGERDGEDGESGV